MSKLNLSDFNIDNENLLKPKATRAKSQTPRKETAKKLSHKVQIGLQEAEYLKLYKEFEGSGLGSFSAYLRLKVLGKKGIKESN